MKSARNESKMIYLNIQITIVQVVLYNSYWNLQFLNNVIINKTKVLLPQAYVTLTESGYPV